MSAEDVWDYDEGEGEEGEAVAGWTDHSSPDGTAPPDLDAVFGRRVGRVEKTIIRAAHAERNADAKSLVRLVAARLGVQGRALQRALEIVDHARGCSQRERAVAALYAARAAPASALVEALVDLGLMKDRDEFYPYRTAYECGLSPGPLDPEMAANIYSVHRLPNTAARLARVRLLDAADRFVRAAIASSRVEGGRAYRARAVKALREVDCQVRGIVDWEEVDEKW
ncbi:MAG: hypothetical protein RAK18_05365 [Conexivisphaerales archaeon]|nr:hypothetical protein [Conexivisphaerales archaeon]